MKTTQQTSRDGIQRETQPVSASAHSANSPAKRSKTPSLKSVNLCTNIKPSGESVQYKNKRRTFLSVWVRCKLSTDVKVYKSVASVSCGQVHWQQVLIGLLSSPRTSLVLPQNSRDSVCVCVQSQRLSKEGWEVLEGGGAHCDIISKISPSRPLSHSVETKLAHFSSHTHELIDGCVLMCLFLYFT